MGFTPPRKRYVLDFSGTELDGLEVKSVSISADQYYQVTALLEQATSNQEVARGIAPHFIEALREWNLEDDRGQPVPATVDGLMKSQELATVMMILEAWIDAMVGISGPLEQPSSDGQPSPVESIPMETLSPNRLSLSTPA